MLNLSVTSKKMIYILLSLGLIAFGLSFAFISKAFAIGIAFGVFVSVARVYLLEDSANKALDRAPNSAKGYMILHYVLRFVFIGFALYISAKSDQIDVIGTFIGIVLLQPSAYLTAFFLKDKDIPFDKDLIIPIEDSKSQGEFNNDEFKEEMKGITKTNSIFKEMFK